MYNSGRDLLFGIIGLILSIALVIGGVKLVMPSEDGDSEKNWKDKLVDWIKGDDTDDQKDDQPQDSNTQDTDRTDQEQTNNSGNTGTDSSNQNDVVLTFDDCYFSVADGTYLETPKYYFAISYNGDSLTAGNTYTVSWRFDSRFLMNPQAVPFGINVNGVTKRTVELLNINPGFSYEEYEPEAFYHYGYYDIDILEGSIDFVASDRGFALLLLYIDADNLSEAINIGTIVKNFDALLDFTVVEKR